VLTIIGARKIRMQFSPLEKKTGVKNKAHLLKIVVLIVNLYNRGKFRADIYSKLSKINSVLSVTAVKLKV
jgi:hypothetical protein